MAIYHLSAQIIGRSAGRSVTAAAAYRAHEKIEDERTGLTHDYTRRRGEVEAFILTPDHAPDWAHDRSALWNEVEKIEKRKDAQLARELNVALPVELTPDQQKDLLKEFIEENMIKRGMIADVAIHRDHPENPHAHIMLTMRDISADRFGKKNRDWNPDFGFGKVQNAEKYVDWREAWANLTNEHLSFYRHAARVDHRSFEAQGIDRPPTIHEGPAVREMEKRGIQTERGEYNRMVKEHAEIVAEQKQNVIDLEAYRREKETLKTELEAAIQKAPEKGSEPSQTTPKQKSIQELMELKIQAQKKRSDLERDRMKHHDLTETRRLIGVNTAYADEARATLRQIETELSSITSRLFHGKKWKSRMQDKEKAERSVHTYERIVKELEEKLPPPKEIARLEATLPKIDGLMSQLNGIIRSIDHEIEERQPPRSRQAKQKKEHEQGRGMSR